MLVASSGCWMLSHSRRSKPAFSPLSSSLAELRSLHAWRCTMAQRSGQTFQCIACNSPRDQEKLAAAWLWLVLAIPPHLDFLRICCYTFCRYDVTQIWHLVSEQLAFWRLQFQSMLLGGSEHVVQVLKVFLKRFAEDQQVVQVNEEDFKQLLAEKALHEALESSRSSGHAKRETFVLKQPKRRDEHCLLFVGFVHCNLVVSRCQVEGREVFGTFQWIQCLFYTWEGEGISARFGIQTSVVYAHPEWSILSGQDNRWGTGTVAWFNDALV